MNTKEFNKKYKDKGGMTMLNKMMASLLPQKVIAHHFKVSQERVRQWSVEFFGKIYDPRPARREQALKTMVDFYKETSMEEFKKAFRGSAYYRKAIDIIINETQS